MPSSATFPFLTASASRRDLARLVRRHRRPIAAALVVLAVALLVRPVAEARGVSATVFVVSRSMEAGEVVDRSDLTEIEIAASSLPDDALTQADQILGSRLTVGASAREVLTPARLVGAPGSLPAGLVVAPVRIADPQAASLVRAGDLVDVLAASGSSGRTDPKGSAATTVAERARVVAAPSSTGDRRGSVFASAPSGFDAGGLVLLAVPVDTAARLAGAATTSRLSVVLRPST